MADEKLISVRLRALTADFETSMRRAGASVRSLQQGADRDLRTLGDTMSSAGRRMTMGLSVPIAAGFALGIRESISFESAMAGVAKTVELTDAEFEAMSEGIRDMARELPASREEIAAVAEAAGQLGIQKGNILEFTRTMIDLGESTNLSADQAATALAQFANITQMPQDQFDNLGSTLVALGNVGASTEADIVDFAQRIAAAGDQAGLSQAEILGVANAMASMGLEAEAGGTALSQTFIRMRDAVLDGGPALEAFARTAGMSADRFQEAFARDPATAITSFVEGLGRISDSGQSVTPVLEAIGLNGLRVRDSLTRAAGAGDLLRDSIELGSRAWDENTALMLEAERRYETTGARMQMAWNRITDAAMTAGDVLVPWVARASEGIATLADRFGELPGPVQAAMVALGLLAAAAGPLIWAAGTLISSWSVLAGAMPAVASALAAVQTQIVGTTAAIYAMNPVLISIAAGLAAAGGMWLVFNDGMTQTFDATDDFLEAMLQADSAVDGFVQHMAQDISPGMAEGLRDLGVTLDEIGAAMIEGGDAWDTMRARLADGHEDAAMIWDAIRSQVVAAAEDFAVLGDVGATGLSAIEQEAQAAEEAIADLETAWAGLNNLLTDTEAAIHARQALRDLKAEAFGALEGGVSAEEQDALTLSLSDVARKFQTVAKEAHTSADGVMDAAGAQRQLRRMMRATADEIPASLLPMWQRMQRQLGREIRLDADGEPARTELERTAARMSERWTGRRFRAFIDALNQQALAAIDEVFRRGNEWDQAVFAATFTGQQSGSLAGGGTFAPESAAFPETGRFRLGAPAAAAPIETHHYYFAASVDELLEAVPREARERGRRHLSGRG